MLQSFRAGSSLPGAEAEAVSELGAFCERPLPRRFASGASPARPEAIGTSDEGQDGALHSVEDDIENIQQFYNWVDSLESHSTTEEDQQLR